MNYIVTELADQIGTIQFNNPARRNALSSALLTELVAALASFQTQKVRVVIIRAGRDDKVWSAGYDITELPQANRDPLAYDAPLEEALRAIRTFPAPVIAMVHGSVWGGACELVLTCDIAIGDRTSSFAITPANLGMPYNTSGVLQFINRVGLNIAKEMFFTAMAIAAERAQQIGILNHLVWEDELESFTYEMANQICTKSPLAIAVIKEQMRVLSAAQAIAPETFDRLQSLRTQVYQSRDYQEGITAFMEKRKPDFVGE